MDGARKEYENQIAALRKSQKQELDTQVQKHKDEKRQLEKKLQLEEEKVMVNKCHLLCLLCTSHYNYAYVVLEFSILVTSTVYHVVMIVL